KKGFEVAAGQFHLPIQAEAQPAIADTMSPLKLQEGQSEITVIGKGFQVAFDKTSGTISRLVCEQKSLLIPGGRPRLHLGRAAHRNDDMWAYKEWHSYGLDALSWSVVSLTATQVSPSAMRVESTVRGEGKNHFAVTHAAVFTVYGDGSI